MQLNQYSKTALNYFTILEMTPSIDLGVIKKCYRKIALKYHPDRNPGDINAANWFKKINEAFEFLSNPLNLSQEFSSSTCDNDFDIRQSTRKHSNFDTWDKDNRTITKGGQHGFQIEIPPGMTLERFMEIIKTDPNIKNFDVNLPYVDENDKSEPDHSSLKS